MPSREREPSVVQELPFNSERQAMSVLLKDDFGRHVPDTKGAPEGILANCVFERSHNQVIALTEDRRQQIVQANVEMASRALRVLALAYRENDAGRSWR